MAGHPEATPVRARRAPVRTALLRFYEPLWGKLVLLGVAITIAINLGAAVAYFVFDNFESYGDALWWAFVHLLDPSALRDDDAWDERLVGVVLVAIGLVLLLGVVIEVLSQVVERSLQRLDEAEPPVTWHGHIVFYGWSRMFAAVLDQMADECEGLGRAAMPSIVVVAPNELRDERAELAETLRVHGRHLRTRLLFADSSGTDGLTRANAARASVVSVLRNDGQGRYLDPDTGDVECITRTISLARFLDDVDDPPRVYYQLTRGDNVDAASSVLPAWFDAIVSDRMVTGLLRIGLLEPDWNQALPRLLGYASTSLRPATGSDGDGALTFAGAATAQSTGVTIAVVHGHGVGVRASIAPAGDLDADDRIVVIGSRPGPGTGPDADLQLASVHPGPPRPFHVLVLGWNERVPTLCQEFFEAHEAQFRVTLLNDVAVDDRTHSVPAQVSEALSLQVIDGSPIDADDLAAAIADAKPDGVVVTSTLDPHANDDNVLQRADARALLCVLQLAQLDGAASRPVITDLFQPDDAAVLDQVAGISILPTARVFAYAIADVALAPDIGLVANAIYGDDDNRPFTVAFAPDDGRPHAFGEVYRNLLEQRVVTYGTASDDRGLQLAPGADLEVRPGDRLLVQVGVDAVRS